MESLAQTAAFIALAFTLLGGVIGSGIGWILSRTLKWPLVRCILIGGTIGFPVGFLSLPLIVRLFN